MFQHAKKNTVPTAERRKALERMAAQIEQALKTLSTGELGEDLTEGLELGGARHPVKSLVEISAACGWYLDNLNPPRRGRPFLDVKYALAERVAGCLENAGVSLTATRASDGGKDGKDGVFVGVLRIMLQAAGVSMDPHGLAENVLSERPLARS